MKNGSAEILAAFAIEHSLPKIQTVIQFFYHRVS